MTKTICVLVAVCCVTLDASADENPLTRRLTPAIRSITRVAEREEHQRLLVVVREMKGVKAPPALLPKIRAAVKELIAKQGLEVVESSTANEVLGSESERKLVEVTQVSDLQQQIEFDALLSVDYQRRGMRTSVRIALVDDERRRIVRTVRLPDNPMPPKFPPFKPPKPVGAGGGLSNPTSSVPPLSKGPTGFRKGGSGKRSTPPRPRRKSPAERPDESQPNGRQRTASAVNQAIVRFAVGQLGKQVGNGECWTLAAEALEAAGAQPPRLYDFGQEIEQDQILPGDILQFTSARFDLPGGGYIIMGTPNHTAVVYALNGDQIFVLHQNFGQKIVTVLDIRFENMTSGQVQAYRAVAAE